MTQMPAAGWFPDPHVPAQQRYWDGAQWTEHVAAAQPAAVVPAQAGAMVFSTDRTSQSAQVIIAWILTVVTFGYFLPWAIAATRGKSNAGAIGLINFLVGWTIVGWIAALVMACGAHQAAVAVRY